MTHVQAPEHIQRDPRLAEVWQRNHHILNAAAFEEKYKRTLLLPLEWEKLRKQVESLKSLIDAVPGIIIKDLADESGIKYGRCREILYSREWLEWYSRKSFGLVSFFPLEEDSGRKLVPTEIHVEYLVAEFERHGFAFRMTWNGGPVLKTLLARTVPPGSFYYLGVYNQQITEYIRRRDAGFSVWWD